MISNHSKSGTGAAANNPPVATPIKSSSSLENNGGTGGRKTRTVQWCLLFAILILLVSFSFQAAASTSSLSLGSTKDIQHNVDEMVYAMLKNAQTTVSTFDIHSILFAAETNKSETDPENDISSSQQGHNITRPAALLNIIPKPTKLRQTSIGNFTLSPGIKIFYTNNLVQAEAELFAETLRASTGFALPIVKGGCELGHICLLLLNERHMKKTKQSPLFSEEEAYVVDVRHNGPPTVGSFTRKGIFYGTQTLLQLLPPAVYGGTTNQNQVSWTIPYVHIEDAPRYKWRGMHLDVARHFMPKEFVLKFINLLAIHKLNSLHLHLSDDQGWRLEIRKYPLLANISAFRDETLIGHQDKRPRRYDGKRYGGFFTQQDIREIVAYATRRHINVVPEIEMPGHTQSVFAAYPKCSCTPDFNFTVKREWGVSNHLFCAGNEHTFEFLENILTEVMELFPSEYIHIGGDECDKVRWDTCPLCQKRMKEENLGSVKELQSYFIKRIEKFLNSHGRKMIGWDEIFDGGLAPHATVMSWRGHDPAFRAARQNHDAIVSDVGHLYFDWYGVKNTTDEPLAWGGHTPLHQVYGVDLLPPNAQLTPDKYHHILGAQGQLWTEYMPTSSQVEYMAFPRTSALAELVWRKRIGPVREHEYDDFFRRLMDGHLPRLDALNVNYRRPRHSRE